MGLPRIPMRRSRDQRLPLFNRRAAKERFSDDDDYYTTDGSESSLSGPSSRESRHTSDSTPSRSFLQGRGRKPTASRNATHGRIYPYRLPSKTFRFIFIVVISLIVLMIISLVRASQQENWRVANGQVATRPAQPALWEKFPFLERYYGGIRTLVSYKDNAPEYPRLGDPEHHEQRAERDSGDATRTTFPSSLSWTDYPSRSKEANITECFLDAAGTVRPPALQYFNGRPAGFPEPVVGSYKVLNLPEEICFERYGKFGPYGFGYSIRKGGLGTGESFEKEGADAVWASSAFVDFRNVNWADVQRRCYHANAELYKSLPAKTAAPQGFFIGDAGSAKGKTSRSEKSSQKSSLGVEEKKARTAVVVRCWDEYPWSEDDVANLRSMISELSLASGGRFDVHLLVQVKNDAAHPVWADHEIYEQRVRDTVPREFQGLATLWTETQMLSLYQGIFDLYSRGPQLPVHGVYRGLSMAMQHFAYLHPEYDYFWQWEMDVRYTGHYHDLLTKMEDWAKAQPRKGLWERNSRFYLPAVHGSWEDFSQMARIQSEMGTVSADNVWKAVPGNGGSASEAIKAPRKTIWGPVRPVAESDWYQTVLDPSPPATEADRSSWGVGEEADLITLNPIFDPEGTTWLLKDDITGFNRSFPLPPRRASIITTSRMSRRLLMMMHKMTAHKKQFAFPEMWPATVALQHGYKAVYAPHPVYVDRRWPLDYMAQIFNGGRDGSSGGSRTSPFGEREHNFKGLSWFYNSGFGPNLYKRWLGLKVNNDGGEEFEKNTDLSKQGQGQGQGVGAMAGGEGRMCLPPMLLHPVKEVILPVEVPPEQAQEESLPESDPSA